MNQDIVLKFITMPMAIKVFKQDKVSFLKSKVDNVYQDLIDSILSKMQSDFTALKKDMYTKHHLNVRYIGKVNNTVRYSVNREMVEFTPEELKNKTEALMKKYLVNAEVETQDRV